MASTWHRVFAPPPAPGGERFHCDSLRRCKSDRNIHTLEKTDSSHLHPFPGCPVPRTFWPFRFRNHQPPPLSIVTLGEGNNISGFHFSPRAFGAAFLCAGEMSAVSHLRFGFWFRRSIASFAIFASLGKSPLLVLFRGPSECGNVSQLLPVCAPSVLCVVVLAIGIESAAVAKCHYDNTATKVG